MSKKKRALRTTIFIACEEEEIAFGDLLRGEAYMRLPSAKAEAAFSFVRSREQAPVATK